MEEKKKLILMEAYRLFSEYGTVGTSVEQIAGNLHISKKTIYSIFDSKDELIGETCSWKMELISTNANAVVSLELPVLEKMIRYADVMFESLKDVTHKIAEDIVGRREQISETMNDYLKTAVFGRFMKLFNQAEAEGMLKKDLDPGRALMQYWEMLSTYLVTQPSDKIPLIMKGENSIAVLVVGSVIGIYRDLLNESGLIEFDDMLSGHSRLAEVFA